MARRKYDIMAALSAPVMHTLHGAGAAPAPAPEPVEPPRAAAQSSADDRVKLTIYLPPAVHNRLREIAYVKRIKQNDIVMSALDAYFEANGWPERCRA